MIQTRWDRRFQKGERSGSGVFPECVAKGSRLTLEVWRLESCSLSVVGVFFFFQRQVEKLKEKCT